MNRCLLKLGFIKCPFEHVVYTRREGNECLIVGVYVDDLLITGTSVSNIFKLKGEMSREFDMSDLGKLSYYLGLEVDQSNGCIEITQTPYAKKLLQKAGMSECNAVKYPMEHKLQFDADKTGEPVNPTYYKSLVGGLRYLVYTRPDIAYAVGIVSRYMERLMVFYLNAISTGGMAFYLDESLITWVSQKQRCVALSSCEAEFMATTAVACQGIWLQRVLSQISDV